MSVKVFILLLHPKFVRDVAGSWPGCWDKWLLREGLFLSKICFILLLENWELEHGLFKQYIIQGKFTFLDVIPEDYHQVFQVRPGLPRQPVQRGSWGVGRWRGTGKSHISFFSLHRGHRDKDMLCAIIASTKWLMRYLFSDNIFSPISLANGKPHWPALWAIKPASLPLFFCSGGHLWLWPIQKLLFDPKSIKSPDHHCIE